VGAAPERGGRGPKATKNVRIFTPGVTRQQEKKPKKKKKHNRHPTCEGGGKEERRSLGGGGHLGLEGTSCGGSHRCLGGIFAARGVFQAPMENRKADWFLEAGRERKAAQSDPPGCGQPFSYLKSQKKEVRGKPFSNLTCRIEDGRGTGRAQNA